MKATRNFLLTASLCLFTLYSSAEVSTESAAENSSDTTVTYYQPASRSGYVSPTNGFRYWKNGYDHTQLEFNIGYVNKSWYCKYPSRTQREDFFGDPNKFFHGFHVSVLYTPAFEWGLGLRTGLGFEIYTSRSALITDFCDRYTEIDLYIPVHASYRYSVNEDFGFSIFAGPAFQWAMDGRYLKWIGTRYYSSYYYWYRQRDVYASEKQTYGSGWPKEVNWQIDLGMTIRYKMMALNFTYSFGLNDHEIESTFDEGQTFEVGAPSRQDKMQATLSFLF